jgi:hypothetical protein
VDADPHRARKLNLREPGEASQRRYVVAGSEISANQSAAERGGDGPRELGF